LTGYVSQNCSQIGISSSDTQNSGTSSSSSSPACEKNCREKERDETGKALLACVTEIKHGLEVQTVDCNINQLKNSLEIAKSLLMDM
jgi:hypothetical protein